MNLRAILLEEPRLEFRHHQFLEDPHDGLSLFGPYGIEVSTHPKNLTLGVIGTSEGINAFNRWSKVVRGPIYPGGDHANHLWPAFPGFAPAFASDLPHDPAWVSNLDPERLKEEAMRKDANKRAAGVVGLYLTEIEKTQKKDEQFGVLICVSLILYGRITVQNPSFREPQARAYRRRNAS